jgi:hypothetical protein
VQKWIKDHNDKFPIDWALTYKTYVQINDEEKSVTLLYDVVYKFFKYLVYLGFLVPFIDQEAEIKRTYSLDPPNKEHAAMLVEALKNVDWYDPDVDNKISQLLAPDGKSMHSYWL